MSLRSSFASALYQLPASDDIDTSFVSAAAVGIAGERASAAGSCVAYRPITQAPITTTAKPDRMVSRVPFFVRCPISTTPFGLHSYIPHRHDRAGVLRRASRPDDTAGQGPWPHLVQAHAYGRSHSRQPHEFSSRHFHTPWISLPQSGQRPSFSRFCSTV